MKDPDVIEVVQEAAPAEVAELDLYQKREKIYTRKIEGFYQRLRLFTGWPLLLGYYLLPWISIDGRQAVWFDLPEREFHIFGLTFWPQDFPLLAFLLIISAYSLFAVTVSAGRVWCGYTCPQTVWTSIFMWIEQKTEGSRNQRIRLDKEPWSAEKLARKGAKHAGWFFVAFMTGMTFVGYFYPIRELVWELATFSTGKWQALWTLFFTLATYVNAGWMREQVCKFMCPYARFQSVMFDRDTLIVSYDPNRGEPRGSACRSARPASTSATGCSTSASAAPCASTPATRSWTRWATPADSSATPAKPSSRAARPTGSGPGFSATSPCSSSWSASSAITSPPGFPWR